MKTALRKVAPGCCRNVLKAERRRWVLGPSGMRGGGGEGAPGVSGRSSWLAIPQAQEDADYIEWLKGQEIQNPDTLKELVSSHPWLLTP